MKKISIGKYFITDKYFRQNLLTMKLSVFFLFLIVIQSTAGALSNNMFLNKMDQSIQQTTISGIISDNEGIPLPGVSVTVQGTTTGTVTDSNGRFELTVPTDATIIASFVGMETQIIDIGDRTFFEITMESDIIGLEEVIAIGYGTVRSSRLTTSIASVQSDKLDMPTGTMTAGLMGKLAGVQVTQTRGTPGRDIDVRVRGVGSINYNLNPLYVVDGYPITGGLNSINMNDIQSIEVLKDAASAAIYGSRASNGVVLITTKGGRKGVTPDISFNASYGLQERFSKVTSFNRNEAIEWEIEKRNQLWVRAGGNADDPNELRPTARQIDPRWLNPESLPDNDWQEVVGRVAPMQNYQLSSSGGTENVSFYVSGDYLDQQGILVNSYFNRMSFVANADADLGRLANMGVRLSAAATERNDPDTDSWYSFAGGAGALNTSVTMPPWVALDEQVVGNMDPFVAASIINPLLWMEETLSRTKGSNFLGNLYLDINLAPRLFWKTSVGAERRTTYREYFIKNYIARDRGSLGDVANAFNENFLTESILRWDIERPGWAFDIMGGGTYQSNFGSSASMSATGFPDESNTIPYHDAIYTLNAATNMRHMTSGASQWRLISFLSRANFALQDKYILTASIRRDGSSRFGSDNRWGWFPSLSFAWLMTEESFMQGVDYLTVAKPRISYGVVGNNNIGNYSSVASLSQTNTVLGSGKSIYTGLAPGGFSNTMLGWEATHTINVGVDLGFVNNRFQFTADYFIANTKDLLLNLPIPQITGFGSSLQNVGEIQNKGFEFEFNSANLSGDFGWNTTLNFSSYRNKVIDLVTDIYSSNWGTTGITTVGEPIGSYYVLTKVGVFQTQEDLDTYPQYGNQNVGDSRYLDLNGDGVVDQDDWSIVGDPHPDFYFGLRNTFSYRGFALSVDIDGSYGNDRMHARGGWIHYLNFDDERGHGFYDRWKSEEEPGNGWRAGVLDNTSTVPSTNWIMDGSYLSVRNMRLAYTFSESMLNRLGGLSGLGMYFNVTNLLSIDEYWNMPQSASRRQTATASLVDYRTGYPIARTFTFGMDINF